jgi:hypothetical protein
MRHPQGTAPLPNRKVARIAKEAVAHAQTVRKVIAGHAVRGSVGQRIRDALERNGIRPEVARAPVPEPPTRPTEVETTRSSLFVPSAHLLRRVNAPRRAYRPDEPAPRSLGLRPLSRREKAELAEDEAALLEAGVSVRRPRTVAECPPEPCPFVSCRHHLYLDVDPVRGYLKINFPGRAVGELEETCSLRVAARKPAGIHVEKGVRPSREVGSLLNITQERVNQIAKGALAKVRAALDEMPPASQAG